MFRLFAGPATKIELKEQKAGHDYIEGKTEVSMEEEALFREQVRSLVVAIGDIKREAIAYVPKHAKRIFCIDLNGNILPKQRKSKKRQHKRCTIKKRLRKRTRRIVK